MDYRFKPKRSRDDFGWHNRGYLPHFDGPQEHQFVTFRLADSMPRELLDEWRAMAETDAQFRKRVEAYLDAGYGKCWLSENRIAEIVQKALLFHDGKRYKLNAWVVMPNHVHLLLWLFAGQHLPDIMHSIKSYSANEANKFLGRQGQFWQAESFDRYIRTPKHFHSVIRYIENNPVKARLCAEPKDWPFSSAAFR